MRFFRLFLAAQILASISGTMSPLWAEGGCAWVEQQRRIIRAELYRDDHSIGNVEKAMAAYDNMMRVADKPEGCDLSAKELMGDMSDRLERIACGGVKDGIEASGRAKASAIAAYRRATGRSVSCEDYQQAAAVRPYSAGSDGSAD
jgi:hypothetical protein